MPGRDLVDRGKELAPLREQAYRELDQNPELTAEQLSEMLGVNKNTATTWKLRWGKQKRRGEQKEKQPRKKKEPVTTFEEIVKAVPDIETLSLLTFQGLMKQLKDKDDTIEALRQDNLDYQQHLSQLKGELENVTKDRNRLLRQYNVKRVETVSLDSVQNRLVPKGK